MAELALGDRATDSSPDGRRAVLKELAGLWIATLLAIRVVVGVQSALGLPDLVRAAVPFLFIYAPVWLCGRRGVDSYAYRLYVPAFRDWRAWWGGLRGALPAIAAFLIPFVPIYHLWQTRLFHAIPSLGRLPRQRVMLPDFVPDAVVAALKTVPPEGWGLVTVVLYQIFFVAIPEEFFYRGYMQTRLNEVFDRKFILFGVPFGHGLWITTIFFAFGHSLVEFRWWHFAIIFPGLVFGLLREKSGGVLPGAFFHAACNISVVILDTMYGLVKPNL